MSDNLRLIRAILLAVAALSAGLAVNANAAPATQTAPGTCLIQVEGRTFVDGPCPYSHAQEMLVILNTRDDETQPYVYLNLDTQTTANASWTGEGWGAHAHSPLGDLTRDGNCWVNDTVRICLPDAAVAELDQDWAKIVVESSPPFAHDCLIEVDGETLLDEPCPGLVAEEEMRINTAFVPRPISASVQFFGEERGYGALLFVGEDQDFRDLGAVTKQDNCWVNDKVRLCMTPAG